ncbi:MAG: hypothetical protein OEY97_10345 [Nitrospirota bacterium]|nr:hypothetical protein [Nitrospirota bacterium]
MHAPSPATASPDRLAPRAARVLMAALLMVLALLVARHFTIVTYPYQHELREGAMPLLTQQMLSGPPLYTLESEPVHFQPYGPGYHWVAYPFAAVFGSTLPVHRALTAFCIALLCGMLYLAARHMGAGREWALTTAAVAYAINLFYVLPLARPDALGQLLMLASVLIPWWFRYSPPSLAFAVACGVFAFFTKTYFVLGLPIVAAYMFLFVSKRKGVLFGLVCAAALAATVGAAAANWEMYLFDTFQHQAGSVSGYSLPHLLRQLKVYTLGYWPVLAIVLAGAGLLWRDARLATPPVRAKGSLLPDRLSLRDLAAPLFSRGVDLPLFALLVTTTLIVYPLGGHKGNYMVYLVELITPFLLLVTTATVMRMSRAAPGGALRYKAALLLLLVHLAQITFVILPQLDTESSGDRATMDRLRELVARADNPFLTQALASVALDQGKPVHDSGMTPFFIYNTIGPRGLFAPNPKALGPEAQHAMQYVRLQDEMLFDRRYDLLVIQDFPDGGVPLDQLYDRRLANLKYRELERHTLHMRQSGQVVPVRVMVPSGPPALPRPADARP